MAEAPQVACCARRHAQRPGERTREHYSEDARRNGAGLPDKRDHGNLFQTGFQQAGPLEQDDRLLPQFSVDTIMVFGTESCVACHYSAGACIGFHKDTTSNRTPLFLERAVKADSMAMAISVWLLQLEAKSKTPSN